MKSFRRQFLIISFALVSTQALSRDNLPGAFLANYFDLRQNQIHARIQTFRLQSDRSLKRNQEFDALIDITSADFQALSLLSEGMGISSQKGILEMLRHVGRYLEENTTASTEDFTKLINQNYTARRYLQLVLLASLPDLDAFTDQSPMLVELKAMTDFHAGRKSTSSKPLFAVDHAGVLSSEMALTIDLLNFKSTIDGKDFSLIKQAIKVLEPAPIAVSGFDTYPILWRLHADFSTSLYRYGVIIRAINQRLGKIESGSFFSSGTCPQMFEFDLLDS